ncbi:CHAD domain-containing protein [Salinigranum sp. GCM10025319]|uniref:CHAD domain-containing protein n=1 Tax=Salinigranum sp. GCM10025319 TaxID=3252687 RepID=UPI003622DA4C
MDYTLDPREPVAAETKRIVGSLVDDGLDHLAMDDRHEAVHEVRKRCKEVRATLRLVRGVLPTYSDENAHYRDAARRISHIRDAQALVETFDDHVVPTVEAHDRLDGDRLGEVRATLVDRHDALAAEEDLDARLDAVERDLREGRERVDSLPIATDGFDAVAGGLRKSYRRGRERMADAYADPSTEAFHEWRKRIKYHRYHCYLLRPIWDEPMKARRDQLKELSDLTGDEHDLAVFCETMDEEELFDVETREILDTAIAGRRSELRRASRPIGERVFAEDPDELVARMRGYWLATVEYDSE